MKISIRQTPFRMSKNFFWIFFLHMAYFHPSLASEAVVGLKEHCLVDVTVTGTVTDAQGEPIPGVTVSVPGTGIGTATDIDGRYSLTVPEGSSLVFSFIGYESQTIAIGDQSVINVTLAEDMASLEEVVVVGYGVQQKKEITGAVASVNSENFIQG